MAKKANRQNGFEFKNEGKSLNELINEVKNSTMSKNNKAIALKLAGLRDNEIEFILDTTYVPNLPTQVASTRFYYTFGVEIECINANRHSLTEAASRNNVALRCEGYNHTDNRRYFKVVSDGSLTGSDANEIVSPILAGQKKGFESIKNIISVLDEVGAKVNSSCGLHVHIGIAKLTDEQYVNIFKNYQKLELAIDSFMAYSRRANNGHYAKSLQDYDFSSCHTKLDVEDVLRCDRYYKLNPVSYLRHSTIEFRQHQGTTNYKKIEMWVKFCAKLVAWSRSNVLTEAINNIDGIPFLSKAEKSFFKARKNEIEERHNNHRG